MKYLMLIYQGTTPLPGTDAWEALPEKEQKAIYADYAAFNKTLGLTPGLPLGLPEDAKTVRVDNGSALVSDGPYVDVKAAVEMLRQRSYIDPSKIALIGIGTGANACVITASKDPAIAAMIITEPVSGFDQAFAARVGSDHKWLPPLKSIFRWTFQVMYGVDCGDLEMSNYNKTIADRHVLVSSSRHQLMDPSTMRGVRLFLLKHLTNDLATAR